MLIAAFDADSLIAAAYGNFEDLTPEALFRSNVVCGLDTLLCGWLSPVCFTTMLAIILTSYTFELSTALNL